jgi:hypothetical protein
MENSREIKIAFPKSETELRVVFSEPVDERSALNLSNYKTRSGLRILDCQVDREDPSRMTLTTEPMNGEAMNVDVLSAHGLFTAQGQAFTGESPEFIQGLASIAEVNKAGSDEYPFASRFVGKVASESCGKDGGVDSNVLISTFGFAFIHMETGGPFNSTKIVTKKHIPGIAEITRTLQPGQTAHVLWAGGEIRNVNGENQLVDTGYMEGSVIPPTPLRSPPPFLIKTKEIGYEAGRTLRAKSLQGVVVRFENVKIDKVSDPDEMGLRHIVFHDDSDAPVSAVLIRNVVTKLQPGQGITSLRGLLHFPTAGQAEVIIELDEHLVLKY